MEATLVQVAKGWAAVGKGWAVVAASKEEATKKYYEAEQRHAEIMAREEAFASLIAHPSDSTGVSTG